MVGLTVRRGQQEGLAKYTFSPEESEAQTKALHQACDFLESVYLATCNRVEVVFLCRRGNARFRVSQAHPWILRCP
jgi:glutamyl-tRNA reductase